MSGKSSRDNYTSQDDRLVGFLQQVSVRTRIYRGAERFVDELYTRWQARRGTTTTTTVLPPTRFLPPAREMPDNAVFISYARDDLAAVQQIKAGLEAAGIITWFDMDRLEAGRRLRPQDPAQHCGLLVFHPGGLGHHPAAPGGLFPPRVELRHRPGPATWPMRPCSVLPGVRGFDQRRRGAGADKFKALHFNHLPGGTRVAGVRACR